MISRAWNKLNKIRMDVFSKINHQTLQEKYVVLLMIRISELCQDAINLLNNDRAASVPILLRSALESYVDLKCLLHQASYIDEMNKSFDFFKTRVGGRNANGRNLMKIADKFKLVGEIDMYKNFYAHLCRNSHGNLEMLVHYHTINGKIVVGSNQTIQNLNSLEKQILALASTTLIDGLMFLNSFDFQIKQLEKIRHQTGC